MALDCRAGRDTSKQPPNCRLCLIQSQHDAHHGLGGSRPPGCVRPGPVDGFRVRPARCPHRRPGDAARLPRRRPAPPGRRGRDPAAGRRAVLPGELPARHRPRRRRGADLAHPVGRRRRHGLGRARPPDALIGRLQAARPGLRPPLFHSAYETLCWAVLSARRPASPDGRGPATALRAVRHGGAGRRSADGGAADSGPAGRGHRLRRAARGQAAPAARGGRGRARGAARHRRRSRRCRSRTPRLDCASSTASARSTRRWSPSAPSATPTLPTLTEPTLLAEAGRLMNDGVPFTAEQFAEAIAPWSPWRTWASVALRAAGPRLQ